MNVAPHAGAWIETKWWPFGRYLVDVAPHAGAWIETLVILAAHSVFRASHPTRVRGLKPAISANNILL